MQKWEYLKLTIEWEFAKGSVSDETTQEKLRRRFKNAQPSELDYLNFLGAEKWELIEILDYPANEESEYYFKRPIES